MRRRGNIFLEGRGKLWRNDDWGEVVRGMRKIDIMRKAEGKWWETWEGCWGEGKIMRDWGLKRNGDERERGKIWGIEEKGWKGTALFLIKKVSRQSEGKEDEEIENG